MKNTRTYMKADAVSATEYEYVFNFKKDEYMVASPHRILNIHYHIKNSNWYHVTPFIVKHRFFKIKNYKIM